MRSRKARYSVKQPSAMCCPLSGGGGGSRSSSGSVWTAPPSVGRVSSTSTSCPASVSSSAAASPASPPPTTATFTLHLAPGAAREKSHSRHRQATIFELPSKAGAGRESAPRGKTNRAGGQMLLAPARRGAPSPEDDSGADDPQLRQRRQARRAAEDVEADLLDPLKRRLVQVRE